MSFTFRQAKQRANDMKKEVNDIVSISSDFDHIPYFQITLTVNEGQQLLKDSYNYQRQIDQRLVHPDRSGLKINGVWFYWDKLKQEAA